MNHIGAILSLIRLFKQIFSSQFFFNATYVEPKPNQKIIDSGQELLVKVFIYNINPNNTYTATLTNEPAGMILDGIIDNYIQISFTPDVVDENKIYEEIDFL